MEGGFGSSEKYGGFSPENFRFEKEEDELSPEAQAEIMKEIDELLADIIEKKDIDPQIKQQQRQQLHALCLNLGVSGIDDPRLIDIRIKLHDTMNGLPTPKGYPEFEDFKKQLEEKMADAKTERGYDLKHDPSIREVATLGRVDLSQIKSRTSGHTLEEYLYNLGKILGNRLAYENIFTDDGIVLRADWSTANGRHRVATIKGLNEEFIALSGLSAWVKTELEPDSVFRDDMKE